MKAVRAVTWGEEFWRQATYSTHNDDGQKVCKKILELDALWRMSQVYESDFYSLDSVTDDASVPALPHTPADKRSFL